jgi:hypothetical protein
VSFDLRATAARRFDGAFRDVLGRPTEFRVGEGEYYASSAMVGGE